MNYKMRNLWLSLIVIVPMTIIAGCLTAGLGPQFTHPVTPEGGKAIIYVYRQRVAMTGHEMPGIKINGKKVVDVLPETTYFPLSVAPGTYEFTPELFAIYKTTSVSVKASAGQVYFVRFKVEFAHLEFAQVNQDEAMAYMATCYLINPEYVDDPRVLNGKSATGATVSAALQPASPLPAPAPAVSPTQAQLFVDCEPGNARIRIMNIKPKFQQGIQLDEGRYHLEVAAEGYVPYSEWITLKTGETRHLNITLASNQLTPAKEAMPAAKAIQPSEVQPVAAPDVSPEELRYAEMLASESPVNIRNAAKNIYYRYYTSQFLTSAAEKSLLKNYNRSPASSVHADAMSWLCKALARTGDPGFRPTLQNVADNANQRKLKRYAQKCLEQL